MDCCLVQKEASLTKNENIYVYKLKYLVQPFSKIIIEGSNLEHWTFPAMGFGQVLESL